MTDNVILFVPPAIVGKLKLGDLIDRCDEIEAVLAGELRKLDRLRAEVVATLAAMPHTLRPAFRRRLNKQLNRLRDAESRLCFRMERNDALRAHLLKAAGQ